MSGLEEGKLKYCKHCGHQLKEGAAFCPECGQSVNLGKSVQKVDSSPVKQESVNRSAGSKRQEIRTEKKPMSKKSKTLISIAIILVITFIGSYTIDRMVMNPQVVSEKFVNAVKAEDTETVKEYINEGQLEMEASNEDVEAFVDYLNEYPRLITSIAQQLDEDAQMLENGGSTEAVANEGGNISGSDVIISNPFSEDENDHTVAQLKQQGKKWLIFDNYVVQVLPVYVDIHSTEDETDIFVNDQEVGQVNSDNSEKIGPLLPGQYEVKAVVAGEYGDVEQTQSLDFFESEEVVETEESLDFNFSNHYLHLYSDNEDATVFVNGESTEKMVEDLSTFGPVPLDGSVEVYAEKEFATDVYKSDTVTIDENTYDVGLYLDHTDYDEQSDLEREQQDELEDLEDEADEVSQLVYDHYNNISNDNYQSAYNLFSSNMQSRFEVDGWAEGLEPNIRNDVTSVEVLDVDGDTAQVHMEMTSYDDQDDGTILIQDWKGSWSLIKENGSWKLDSNELESVDSRTEE